MLNFLDWRWMHSEWVHLIWAAVAVTTVVAYFEVRGRAVLGKVLSPLMQHRLADRISLERRVARLALFFACLSFGILALMRPYVPGEKVATSGKKVAADIVVALDVSKSMLAEDAAPNRLERAKAEIGSLVDRLAGHRIGLVAFAGRAAVLSPLTSDYGFYRMILRGADTTSVSRGGTRIGDALRTSIKAFPPGSGAKIILLITDGEDHESFPVDAAKAAAELGIRIFAIGFGSEEGSEIQVTDPQTGVRKPVTDKEGNVVTTRLDGELLREISVELTKGVYVPAATSALDLDSIRAEHIDPVVQADARATQRLAPNELYPWFTLLSLLTLLASIFAGSSASRRRL